MRNQDTLNQNKGITTQIPHFGKLETFSIKMNLAKSEYFVREIRVILNSSIL